MSGRRERAEMRRLEVRPPVQPPVPSRVRPEVLP